MNIVIRMILILTSISLVSCAHWPEAGYGGFAEFRMEELITSEAGQPLRPEHGLRYDYSQLKNYLDILVIRGAAVCFPAATHQAELKEWRIARELRGKLYGDAASDILIQRTNLSQLERQLDLVLKGGTCELELQALRPLKAGTDKAYLLSLLNGDSQFATGSAEINPKYYSRLTVAAKYIRKAHLWQVNITGHSDARGSAAYNLSLSERRAQSVAQLLRANGVEPEYIKTHSIGSTDPLYEGENVETLLVNRSVVIDLESIK